ncbi:hypothetical protein [Candidatus Methylobacter oryzae]|uniref:Uncharacterized protein n=1 Tax=Candidatus Methylobacter oryzae TaxID=2497749 RepID=A0ABY3C5U6_9GAMM|nr:hypothetical protein [Candidatus Methylobacter oryzae]TRW89989.1 hypothetical protein EKO24_020430 [Candidatus Methylobacter oryzae]
MKTVLESLSGLVSSLTAIFCPKKQEACSAKETPVSAPAPEAKAAEQQKQQPEPEIKPVADVEVNAEPTAVNSQITDTVAVASTPAPEPVKQPVETPAPVKQQAKEAPAPTVEKDIEFPEDSILKRHYFTHIFTMVEALSPECPEDSVLRRHHYTLLISEIDQCLHDKKAMEKLINDYQHLSA